MCRVSIIMPIYNKRPYLEKIIKTIINQEYHDWELILIDDGSTDGSTQIIDYYAKIYSNIVAIHQENHGVSFTRNKGIDISSGEWIWFIDADDIPDREFLYKIDRMYLLDDYELIIGQYKTHDLHTGEEKKITVEFEGNSGSRELADLFINYQYNNGYFGYLWNKLVRKRVIDECSIRFNNQLKLAEDLDFLVSVFSHSKKIYFTNSNALTYMLNTINCSSLDNVDYYQQLQIQMKINEWICDKNKMIKYQDFMNEKISYYAAFDIYYTFVDGNDYCSKFNAVINDSNIMKHIDYKVVKYPMKPIVKGIKRKSITYIRTFMKIRQFIVSIRNKVKRSTK